MAKKIILCALCAVIAFGLIGCNEEKSNDTNTDIISGSAASNSAIASDETLTEDSEISDDDSTSEGTFVDADGTDLFLPAGFTDVELWAYGKYFYKKPFGNDTIYFYFDANSWYGLDTDIDSYDLEDVPAIETNELPDAVYEVIDCYISRLNKTVETETNETIAGMSFIKETGTMHTEYEEPDDTHDLKYISLYTLYDSKYYTKIPTSIILFSDCYDEETEAELERLAEEIVTKTKWVKE